MTAENLIFVTGFFGAPIREEADRIASGKGWEVLDLDRAIEEKDGRTIARLCMMAGEHAYRNAEYEAVQKLCEEERDLVVACGDGILYDDDSRELILQQDLVIAGEDLTIEELWARARAEETTYHAFMKFGSEEEKRAKFEAHHKRQQALFDQVRARTAGANADK